MLLIEPRKPVDDETIDNKLRMVAPQVAKHDEELMNLRVKLGQ